jgi:hypothetical protein
LKEALIKAGIAPWLAKELLQFMPLAFARAYMNGMGVKFADDYICLNPQTKKEILKSFDDEPVYRGSIEVAFYIINNNLASEAFQAIVLRSCELNAVNKEYQKSYLENLFEWIFGWIFELYNAGFPCGCFIIFFSSGVVMVFLVSSAVKDYSVKDYRYLHPFEAHVREYSTVFGLKNRSMNNPNLMEPYIKGKIITVNKKESRIDDIYFDLPKELRAFKPKDVGTILWLKCEEDEVGFYTNGEEATVNICQVTIIDKSTPTIVARTSFRGLIRPIQRK